MSPPDPSSAPSRPPLPRARGASARGSRASGPGGGLLGPALLCLFAGGLDTLACGLHRAARPAPPPAASTALAGARAALRLAAPGEREALAAVRAAATAAAEGAAGWVAPRRLLDDLEVRALRGPDVVARYREELARAEDPATLYLLGRLEGPAGRARFQRAARLDPSFAWAWHGIAWERFRGGDARGAVGPGERARALAREPWERAYFAGTLARYLLALEREGAAVAALEEALAQPGLADSDRVETALLLARAELGSEDEDRVDRGLRRATRLLRGTDLGADEVAQLAAAILGSRRAGGPGGAEAALLELEAAAGAREGAGRAELVASLRLRAGDAALGLAAAASAAEGDPRGAAELALDPRGVAARLAVGDGPAAIEAWRAALPGAVVDASGLPRDERLRALVLAARTADDAAGAARLGDALLAAGWFTEARGLAEHLARREPAAARALERRGIEGELLLAGLADVLERVDRGRGARADWVGRAGDAFTVERPVGADGVPVRRIDTLADVLAALQPLFDRFDGRSAPGTEVLGSPITAPAPGVRLVHPGPRFSSADEAAGLGRAGAPVPGLAAWLAAIGRFGIFGEAPGQGGPDGTVLRRLWVEPKEGAHLGVPFRGTVVWCDGTELGSRPVRSGADIVGAALHEGYWIDVAGLRRELARWRALERRLEPEGDVDGGAALAVRGPRLEAGGEGRALERRSLAAPLGAADRIRVAVLAERRAADPGARDLVSLDEIVALTALHEEGHLCDRTRFLPLGRNLGDALGLLLQARFSPRGLMEALEYRAQLTALCEAPDPRMALAECVDGLEGDGVTPHGAAYARLLADLLEEIDRDLASHAGLDPDRRLLWQLHCLDPEGVRRAARALAGRRGMLVD